MDTTVDKSSEVEEDGAQMLPAFNRNDLAVLVAKGTLGPVPVVGPFIGEILGALIPNQRFDRLTRFVEALSLRLAEVEATNLEDRWRDPQMVDLTEDVLIQAARARTEERIGYLASFLKNALTDEEVAAVDNATILDLLGQLNDVEIVLLRAKSSHPKLDQDFWEAHRSTIYVEPPHSGLSPAQVDRAVLHDSYNAHIVQLHLVQPIYNIDRSKMPEFDTTTGTLKTNGYRVTRLGRMLLQRIDFAPSQWM